MSSLLQFTTMNFLGWLLTTRKRRMTDLRDSATDFAEGRVDDPARDAYRIMLATATLLEEEVISNSIQATKFLASTFGAISLSK